VGPRGAHVMELEETSGNAPQHQDIGLEWEVGKCWKNQVEVVFSSPGSQSINEKSSVSRALSLSPLARSTRLTLEQVAETSTWY
jgi:hypothetical protein